MTNAVLMNDDVMDMVVGGKVWNKPTAADLKRFGFSDRVRLKPGDSDRYEVVTGIDINTYQPVWGGSFTAQQMLDEVALRWGSNNESYTNMKNYCTSFLEFMNRAMNEYADFI